MFDFSDFDGFDATEEKENTVEHYTTSCPSVKEGTPLSELMFYVNGELSIVAKLPSWLISAPLAKELPYVDFSNLRGKLTRIVREKRKEETALGFKPQTTTGKSVTAFWVTYKDNKTTVVALDPLLEEYLGMADDKLTANVPDESLKGTLFDI